MDNGIETAKALALVKSASYLESLEKLTYNIVDNKATIPVTTTISTNEKPLLYFM